MSPHDFLAAVLPSPGHGYYCAAELSSKKKQHVFVEKIEEFTTPTQKWLEKKYDVYFALASFDAPDSRLA